MAILKRGLELILAASLAAGMNSSCVPGMYRGVTFSTVDRNCSVLEDMAYHGFTFKVCREDITDKLKSSLEFVADVKRFGTEAYGLKKTENYMHYVNESRRKAKIVYELHIVPKNKVPGKARYRFIRADGHYYNREGMPIVYWSYIDNLKDEDDYYKMSGYETSYREVRNFGNGANLTSSFLKRKKMLVAATLLHEDFHYNISKYEKKNMDSEVEEPQATLIGMVGAIEYAKRKYGAYSENYKQAVKRLNDWEWFSGVVNKYHGLITETMNSKLPDGEKAKRKQEYLAKVSAEFREKTNYADLWAYLPYTKHFPLVHQIYNANPDLKRLYGIFRNCPDSEDKALPYIRNFLK